MKSLIFAGGTLLTVIALARDPQFDEAPFMNPRLSADERIEDLISKMTVKEKVALLCTCGGFGAYEIRGEEVMPSRYVRELYAKFPGCGLGSFFRADWYSGRNWKTGLRPELLIAAYNALQRFAVEETRLGIPLSLTAAQMLGETQMPSGLGCAAMFDPALHRKAAQMNIREYRTFTKIWRVGFPQATLALDPRWSRCEQTYGEDPFLSAEYVVARCSGAKDLGASSYLESFVGHGLGEGGHMVTPVHIDDNELYNVHMRPFVSGVKAGCDAIMCCYNLVGGLPGVLRGDLVNGFLRERVGFKGVVYADAGAIWNLQDQGFASDLGDAATLVLRNGMDLCCWEAENYLGGLVQALGRGQIRESELEPSLRRVLRPRFEAGLFEDPYIDPERHAKLFGRPEDVIGCRQHRDLVLEMARKTMTLIENRGNTLPLDPKKIRRLAVIGPNADKPENQIGDYSAPQRPGQTITPRLAFEKMGREYGFEVEYQLGCKIRSLNKKGFESAIAAAKRADAVVVCVGTSSVPDQALTQNDAGTAICERIQTDTELDKDCGEGFDCTRLRLHGVQNELMSALKATGKPVIAVLITGRPLVLTEIVRNSDALLLAWYPGTEGGTAIAETVFGLNNPGGKLPVSIPRTEGALPCYYYQLAPRANYVDCEGSAAYPFGYGLSYTTFEIGKPEVSGRCVSAKVKNTGSVRGDEVVQMYVKDVKFSIARPLWELRGFSRITLEPGEERTVCFDLTEKELGFWNAAHEFIIEPGEFRIAITDGFDMEKIDKSSQAIFVQENLWKSEEFNFRGGR